MASFDIAIHGTGLVGHSLALHLAKARFKVALVAKEAPSGAEDIRAFALGHAAKAWLAPIGAWSEGLDTTPVAAMHITGDAGGVLDFKSQAAQGSLNWIVEVPALAARLSQLVANEPLIHQPMQTAPQATLHVVRDRRCDLWRSHVQPHTQGFMANTPYGQHAIAAKLSGSQPHGQTALQWFNDTGEVLALLPTGGMDGSTYALVWSLTSNRALKLAKAEPADFLEQLSAAQIGTASPLALALASERVLWPLNLSQVDVWTAQASDAGSQHWVLAGDAAHTVHPLAGQGLNLGFGDVALLAHRLIALRDSRGATLPFKPANTQLQRMLRSYARERKAAVARIASVTDGLHLLYARPNTAVRGLRNLGMNAVNNLSLVKQWLIQQAQS